jgi:hypothetical protein
VRERRQSSTVLLGNPERNGTHFGHLEVDGSTMLKWIFSKYGKDEKWSGNMNGYCNVH